MREMKDSGVAWIGEIPKTWDIVYPKLLFMQRKQKAIQGERQLTASQQHGVIYQDDYMQLTGARVVVVEKDFDILKHVEAGDFVISMRSFQGGIEYSENSGSISSAYVMLIPNREFVWDRYYKWVLKSSAYIDALQSTSDLIRDGQAMRFANFIKVPLMKVSIDEQKAIAAHLDTKCAQIDALISNNEAQIEKLKQYKQSLITEVVTKGLDPTVPMKDSGVEWIGQIPEHWELNRIKYICKFNPSNKCNMDSTHTVSYAPMECVKNGYMLCKEITIDKVSSGLTYFEEEDIIMAKVTPCFENGNIAIAENLKNGVGFGSSELFVFRCLQVYNRWLMYFLRSNTFVERAKATMTGTGGLKRVSPNFVNSLTLAIPPKTEQVQISTYLDIKCTQIDSLIAIKQAKIEKLNQYKKSLIYEYVTGKKEAN